MAVSFTAGSLRRQSIATAPSPPLQRWSIDLQQEVGRNTAASLGYVGSQGTKLKTQSDLNLPAQGVYLNSDDYHAARPPYRGSSRAVGLYRAVHHNRSNNYHALTAQLETQGWHNLTGVIGYTWSKQMDTFLRRERREWRAIHRRAMASGMVVWPLGHQSHEPDCVGTV
jgi:hypothetical protein